LGELHRLTASGADVVEETWQKFVPSARLQRMVPANASFSWNAWSTEGMSVVGYDLHADVESSIRPEDQLMVCRVASRDLRITGEHRALDPRRPWATSGAPVRARWGGSARVSAFIFEVEYAQDVARRITGDDRLELRVVDPAPLSDGAARHWERVYRHLTNSLAAADEWGEAEATIESDLRRYAVTTVLGAFATTYVEAAERVSQRTAAPVTVRRAIAFMEAHAGEPITIDDVALAAAISTRGLQLAFQRALGTSPSDYLRRLRLAGAHDDLRSGDPASIGAIARRWGFGSASRFAMHYRETYGRLPRDTVRMG
jgi:AraC-like DNA-binding protein